MKAIILAAGLGKRMGAVTQTHPKCLAIRLGGKSLLERLLENLRDCGISDISIVCGHRQERIAREPGVTYFMNRRYRKTELLESLMCARSKLKGDVVVSYSDIWYQPHVLKRMLSSRRAIAIAVDTQWREHYKNRTAHPITEADQALFDAGRRVSHVGKMGLPGYLADGEFIGLMRLNGRGCRLLRQHYQRAKARFSGKAFQRASRFERAYLTDLLQEMIDQGVPVHCETIQGGWGEIDTQQDFRRAKARFKIGEGGTR